MESAPRTASGSKAMVWTGRIISALIVLMMVMSGAMKIAKPPSLAEGFAKLGYPESLALGIGIAEIVSAIIYAIPRTAVLGAILLTGYLGGATATNVRVEDPMFILPVVVGILVWLGLFLRDGRIRALLPLRN